jgi:site-specific recombinase XerD
MALDYIGKPESEITYMDLVNWKNTFTNLKPNSQNIRISAIKNYFAFLKKSKVIEENPADGLEKQKIRDCDVKQKPYIEAHYLRDMVNHARTIRDKAIILLFATTGLRVSELTNLTVEQYINLDGLDGRELAIVGKGNKVRRVYINDEVKEMIDNYLNTRPKSNYNNLFLSYYGGPIHSNNLSQTLKNVAKKAGYPMWKDICNHALRSAFATTKAEQGTPLTTIQASMGHSKLETTLIYIKRNQNAINSAMKNMAF